MAVWENVTKTSAGLGLDQKLIGGDTALTFTKAKSGSGKVNPVQLVQQTEVSGPVQDLELKNLVRSDSDTTVTIPVLLENAGLDHGYSLQQVGIYASDPDGGEVLYLIAQTSQEGGELVPSAVDSPGFSISWNFAVNVANSHQVEVVLNEAGKMTLEQGDSRYAKKADLDVLREEVGNIDITSQLTGYYTKTETDTAIQNAIDTEIMSVLEGEF